jgi:predicted nucleic acid binding AN1-type Zn finger protein
MDSTKTDKSTDKSKNKRKIRCLVCNKNLKMMIFTCKCNGNFCQSHLSPHSHNCSFDYKKEKKEQIEKNNPKLGSKVIKI